MPLNKETTQNFIETPLCHPFSDKKKKIINDTSI